MPDFNIRSDSVNVEQIMEQIRARIREKRGVDYTEQQIRELASVKLEKFLDPRGVRSDLLEQFRRAQPPPPTRPNYSFEEGTLFDTHRGLIRAIRRMLQPILKLFFNPNPLIQALHIQSQLNTINAERESAGYALDQLSYELMHNLVIELTRLGIEAKALKMRVESLASRLEFTERRARALESAVMYRPQAPEPGPAPAREVGAPPPPRTGSLPSTDMGGTAPRLPEGARSEGPGQRSRRRRRRRGRRSDVPASAVMGAAPASRADEAPGDYPAREANEAARDAAAAPDRLAEPVEREPAADSHAAESRPDDEPAGPYRPDPSDQ